MAQLVLKDVSTLVSVHELDTGAARPLREVNQDGVAVLNVTQRAHMDIPMLQALSFSAAAHRDHDGTARGQGACCLLRDLDGTLEEEIVPYLISREVVGVVELGGGRMVHLVPPVPFACAHLAGNAPDLFAEVQAQAQGSPNPQCYALAFITDTTNSPEVHHIKSPRRGSPELDPLAQAFAAPPAELVEKAGLSSPRAMSPLFSNPGLFPARQSPPPAGCEYCAMFNQDTLQTCRYCCRQPNPPFK